MAVQERTDPLSPATRRLLRYRTPLILAVLVNCMLLARVPWAQMRQTAPVDQQAVATRPAQPQPAATESPTVVEVAPTNPEVDPANVDTPAVEPVWEPTFEPPAPPNTPAGADLDPPSLVIDATPETPQQLDPQHTLTIELPPLPEAATPIVPDVEEQLPATLQQFVWLSRQFSDAAQDTERDPFVDWEPRVARAVDPPPVTTPPVEFPAVETPEVEPAPRIAPPAADVAVTRLTNPQHNVGSVSFLADGAEFTLQPGESRHWMGAHPVLLEYHRGGEFGEAMQVLLPGQYEFAVSAAGWIIR